jgi:hypothetical protein
MAIYREQRGIQRGKLPPARGDTLGEITMPILIQSESGTQSVSPIPFSSEQELEKALMEHPGTSSGR